MAGFGKKKKPAAKDAGEALPEVTTSRTGIRTIPGVPVNTVQTLLIGTAPLVTHKFDAKMRKMMEDAQQGIAKGAKQPKNPQSNFEGARYRLFDGSDGVPAGGLKACFVSGARGEASATMAGSKGAISVVPDDLTGNLVRILSEPPTMRTDVTRNQTGVADIRYRPQYWPWCMLVTVEYLPSLLSDSQLLQMIAHAGRAEGLCEWRPGSPKSKSGQWGTFALATPEQIDAFEAGTLLDMLREQYAPMKIAAE